MYDILILGGGPAGVSAALTAYNRRRSVLVLSNAPESSPLWKAKLVTNYPGMDRVTGPQMLEGMHRQLRALEIPVVYRKVVQVMALGDSLNDYSMLSMDFGATVAMENAVPEIRRVAKYTTRSNVEFGVAYAIRELLKHQGPVR